MLPRSRLKPLLYLSLGLFFLYLMPDRQAFAAQHPCVGTSQRLRFAYRKYLARPKIGNAALHPEHHGTIIAARAIAGGADPRDYIGHGIKPLTALGLMTMALGTAGRFTDDELQIQAANNHFSRNEVDSGFRSLGVNIIPGAKVLMLTTGRYYDVGRRIYGGYLGARSPSSQEHATNFVAIVPKGRGRVKVHDISGGKVYDVRSGVARRAFYENGGNGHPVSNLYVQYYRDVLGYNGYSNRDLFRAF